MKKRKFVSIIIFIIAIWGTMFITDLFRTQSNKAPIFCISFAEYSISSGYVAYTGLFYKVENTTAEVNGNIEVNYKILPW